MFSCCSSTFCFLDERWQVGVRTFFVSIMSEINGWIHFQFQVTHNYTRSFCIISDFTFQLRNIYKLRAITEAEIWSIQIINMKTIHFLVYPPTLRFKTQMLKWILKIHKFPWYLAIPDVEPWYHRYHLNVLGKISSQTKSIEIIFITPKTPKINHHQ